jgi:hypothetical protein
MVGEKLRPAGASAGLEFLEEAGHLDRVVTGLRGDLCAEQVGLRFGRAGVLQQEGVGAQADTDLAELRQDGLVAQHLGRQQDGQLDQVRLAGLIGAVAERHVNDLVGQHARQLGFVVRRRDQPGVDESRAARQGERIDALVVHHFERVGELARLRLRGEAGSDGGDVGGQLPVVDDLHLFLDFAGRLLA